MKNYLARVNQPVLEKYVGIIKKIEELQGDSGISIGWLDRERADVHMEILRQAGLGGPNASEDERDACQDQLDKYVYRKLKR